MHKPAHSVFNKVLQPTMKQIPQIDKVFKV